MDKKKRLVFNYFDMIFSGYEKHGRRPYYMNAPHVLYDYQNNEGRVAFQYNTETNIINFQDEDFYTAVNMLGISVWDIVNICKEYVADKFKDQSALKAYFYANKIKS